MVDTRYFASDDDNRDLLNAEGALRSNHILQNRYRIEGVLGVGGMGSVYQARDLQFPEARRYVAVKEMLHHTNDPQLREIALKNFRREANILAGLNHPAIPTIHDYFATKERAYLVMEYIEGTDLDNLLVRSADFLPVQQVLEWAIDLCDVMEYLHNSDPPIIFRDIKPSNIMIDVHNRLRLIDFGIAKHFEPNSKGTMIGTEGYAAPESYRGKAVPTSDIYGVGATLHHIFTRHDPRLEAPFTFAERPIRDINPTVSPELESLVMRALAFSPDERFKSALEMKEALRQFLPRHGQLSTVAGAAPAEASKQGWGDAIADGIEPRWKFKVEEEIRSRPLFYKDTVYITAYDNNLYAIDADNGELKWKYAAEDVIASSPEISEEDGLVIFGSKDGTLYAVDHRSGRIQWTYPTRIPIYSSPSVKHKHVFFGGDDEHLYALRANSGRLAWKMRAHAPVRCKPAITEERVLFGDKSGEFFCLDLGGQVKWRFRARRDVLSSPAVGHGLVFFGSMDGYLYAIDVDNGWAAWKMQSMRPIVSSPTVVGDYVYVGGVDGFMYCVDASNGRERWKFNTQDQITSSPTVYNDAVYFGANNHKVYCVDAKTGKERWAYDTGGIVPGSPTAANGTVYIGSTDEHLYAFRA